MVPTLLNYFDGTHKNIPNDYDNVSIYSTLNFRMFTLQFWN